ncbi:MAG TPA: hypothetical protein VMY78_16045 [Solirubrobacteraceae bacterium]|nr:hypothetical protein [Solirubrobacteraceae bacterium]
MNRWIAAAAACGVLLAGCGSDGDDEATPAAPAPPAKSTAAAASHTPTSDVSANAAIGQDVAAIRALIEPEGGAQPDFAAAEKIWSQGQNSKKSDGTNRTLAGFVEEHPSGARVAHAFAGNGTAAKLSDEQRVAWIDKGMVVGLKVHALEEFDGAKEKLAAGELDPQEGAIHNVDEVWAYFTAGGEGVIATAAKRVADFGMDEQSLGNAVIDGITEAREAVAAKDAAALDAAAAQTRGAMNRIFCAGDEEVRGRGREGRDRAVGGRRVLVGAHRRAQRGRPEVAADRAGHGCAGREQHARRRGLEARLHEPVARIPGGGCGVRASAP